MSTPAERHLRASMAANALHAKTDAKTVTAPARAAFLLRFEIEVDPAGELPIEERRKRAESARKSHMQGLALKSLEARRKKKAS